MIVWLCEQWESRPGQSSVLIALSQEHAIRIGWGVVADLNRRLGWGAVYNGTDGAWKFPNGFRLFYMGCKDLRSANFLRGIPKIHRVAVDECGQIPDQLLQYLIRDVVEPTLADTDGDLCMAGTPSDTGIGFYEDQMQACEAVGAHFCHTAASNPHLAVDGTEFLARMLRERFRGDASHPTYRREYLGHRVRDEGVLIYIAPPPDQFYMPAPPASNYTAMGLDVAWEDGFGFVAGRSRAPNPGVHVLEAYRERHLTLPRAAAIAARMMAEYGIAEIFADSQGFNGSTICNTLAISYGLPCVPADKRARRLRIEQVRTMLDSRTLTGSEGKCEQLLAEWEGLPWDADRSDHRSGYIDECTDALQYLLRAEALSQQTGWDVELSPEELRRRKIEQVKRDRAGRGRGLGGRR